ncbi:MAG: hypothetical protein IJI25_00135 [Eubacterium sp.]|nr:hypothetical protein [Eubacterium sp.]
MKISGPDDRWADKVLDEAFRIRRLEGNKYKDSYYRADTAEFDGQIFIVISSIDDPAFAEIGIMEDIEAFPWDISDDMLEKEVRYVLEIDPEPVTFL